MEALKHLEALISEKLSVIKTVFSIFLLEARLAGLSVSPLLINICFLLVILVTLWLSAMLLMGYFIFLTSNNFILSIAIVLFFNLVLFLGLLQYLSYNLKNMSFENTRAYFSKNKSMDHEKLQKADDTANCNNE